MLSTKFKCSCVNLGATLVQHTRIRTHICKFAHTGIQNQQQKQHRQQQQLVNFAAKQQTRKPAPSPRRPLHDWQPAKAIHQNCTFLPKLLVLVLPSSFFAPPSPLLLLLLTKLNLICFARRSRTHGDSIEIASLSGPS